MRILCEIGNTIDPSIQLEPDAPSQHGDNKLPILDLKMWVGEGGLIRHSFFKKEVASN